MFTKTIGHLSTRVENNTTYIVLTGDFDSSLNEPFDNLVLELTSEGIKDIIVDLELCTFLYSVGVGKIVALYKKLEKIEDSSFSVSNPDDRIKKLLHLVNLDFLIK